MRKIIWHIPLVGKYHGIRFTFGWGSTAVLGGGLSLDANPESNGCLRFSVALSIMTTWLEMEVL